MTEVLKIDSRIVCNCGGDCGTVKVKDMENNNFGKMVLKLIILNSRFKYVLTSIIIAILGLLTVSIIDKQFTEYLWILSAIIGIILPIKGAYRSLKKKSMTINTLLVVATISAISIQLYMEAMVLVIVFSAGEIIEGVMVSMTDKELDTLKSMVPSEATLLFSDGTSKTIKTSELKQNQSIIIRNGDVIPVDGVIVSGVIDIQTSHLTGESDTSIAQAGDKIFAGSVVVAGSCTLRSLVDAGENQIDFVVKSVDDALKQKSSAELFSKKFANRYTPVTFVLALFTAFGMPFISPLPSEVWVYRSLVILVVSCACGLALSVPITMVSTVSSAAKRGILIRGGSTIERLSDIKIVIFDKTGTLTKGKPVIKDIILFNNTNIMPELLLLSRGSSHPISQSIVSYLTGIGTKVDKLKIKNFEEKAGQGIIGMINGHHYEIVKDIEYKFLNEIKQRYDTPKTYSIVRMDNLDIGYIVVEDEIRAESKAVVKELHQRGIMVAMISGDQYEVCESVANELQIDDFRAEVGPLEKVTALKEFKNKYGAVIMIGDGINDTPAFAHSDVSIAMGYSGTQIASDIADIVLLKDNISDIPLIINHGLRAFNTAKFNLVIALITIFTLLILAFTGVLNLVTGIFANELTALLIIANGIRLLKFHTNHS